jgi:hypothetical protein
MGKRASRQRTNSRVRAESTPKASPPTSLPTWVLPLVLRALPVLAVLFLLAPYLWPLDRAPTSPFSDIHHYHAPMMQLLADGLRRDGELPRWNVQDFAGMPTLGDPQTQMYNPLQWPFLLRPSLHAFGPLIVVYALAGAAGFLLYAWALGISDAGAAAGAVAFTFGGALLLHLVLPGHTVFAPFFLVPLLLATLHRVANAPRPRRVAAGAALVGLLAVSLHPQLLFYSGCIIAVICAATARRAPHRGHALAAVAAAAFLGLALAAVHLLPIGAFASEFSRGQAALFDPSEATADMSPGAGWFADVVSGRDAAPDAEINWETHYYLGGVTLALALIGLCAWPRRHERRHLVWLHGAIALVLLLFGLDRAGGIAPWLGRLPGFAYFRIPSRALVLLGLPVGLLVALGVDALARAPVRRCRVIAGTACVLALVLLAATHADGVHVLTLAIAAAGAACMSGSTGTRAGVGALLVVGAVAVDSAALVAPYIQTAPETTIGGLARGVVLPDDVAGAIRVAELERGAVEPGIPEIAVRRHGLETLAGFNPLIPWRFVLYASYAAGFDPFQDHFDVAVPLLAREEPVLFDLLGVTHILHPPSESVRTWHWERSAGAFPRAYLVPGPIVMPEDEDKTPIERDVAALERLAALDPRTHVLLHGPAAEATLTAIDAGPGTELEAYRPVPLATRTANHLALDVRLERPGILVLNEPFFPGWNASDGGHAIPVLRANVLFRALALAPGQHHITLEFAPSAWRVGWWISLGAAALTLALAVVPRWRRRE